MAVYDQMRRNSLYVGDLHPEVTESDIIDTFTLAGPLLSVRLCRDKLSGKSLRYAYVNYWLPCHANSALQCLNHTLLRGKPMRIMRYEKDSIAFARKYGIGNLFVKNLDQSITGARLQSIFFKYGAILSCKVVEKDGISRGYGYVQFDSEYSAAAAVEALNGTELEGKKLYVAKFQSKIERKGAGTGDILHGLGYKNPTVGRALKKDECSNFHYYFPTDSKLVVKNLAPSVDDKKLANLFSGYGKLRFAKVIRAGGVSGVYGSVSFSCPDEAKMALESLTGTEFEGRVLHVEMAKPKPIEPYAFVPMPYYTSVNQQPCYNFPGLSPPIRWAASKSYNRLQDIPGLIMNGNEKAFCEDYGTAKTFYVRQSQVTYKKKPGYVLQIDQDQKPCNKLNGKLDNGDGKELPDSSDTMKTHCTESSPDNNKNLQPGNTDVTPMS